MSTQTIFKPEQLKTFNFKVEREESLNSQGFDTGFDNVFNASTGVNLGVVSREYKLVTHKEAIFNVVDTFKKNGLPGIEPVNVRMSGGGARMYAEFRFKQEMKLGIHAIEDPKVGDVIAPGFKITNSYDRSVKYEISAYILRLICTNGATVNDMLYSERKRHSKNLDIQSMVERFMEKFANFDRKVLPQVVALSRQSVNPVVLQEHLNDVPGFMQDEALDYLEHHKFVKFHDNDGAVELEMTKKMSSWDLLNTFTNTLSHNKVITEERRNDLSRQISEKFGL